VHLLAAIGALGFAAHVLLSQPESKQHSPVAHANDTEEQFGRTALENAPVAHEPQQAAPGAAAPSSSTLDPARLEHALDDDPQEVLRQIANALPHNERDAQRLRLLEVRALVRQGKVGLARTRAQDYFERWPGGPDVAALELLTGAHPTR
jgi:hypothetical protein